MNGSKNKKILFVAHDFHQYQAYVQGVALDNIRDEVTFLVADARLKNFDFGVSADRVLFYMFPEQKDILHRHIFNINTWIHRNRNIGFKIRTLLFTPHQKRIYRILALPVLNRFFKLFFLERARDRKLYHLIKKINHLIIKIIYF